MQCNVIYAKTKCSKFAADQHHWVMTVHIVLHAKILTLFKVHSQQPKPQSVVNIYATSCKPGQAVHLDTKSNDTLWFQCFINYYQAQDHFFLYRLLKLALKASAIVLFPKKKFCKLLFVLHI